MYCQVPGVNLPLVYAFGGYAKFCLCAPVVLGKFLKE